METLVHDIIHFVHGCHSFYRYLCRQMGLLSLVGLEAGLLLRMPSESPGFADAGSDCRMREGAPTYQ